MIALLRLLFVVVAAFAAGTATGLVLIGPALLEMAEKSGRILLPFILTSVALLIGSAAYALRIFFR